MNDAATHPAAPATSRSSSASEPSADILMITHRRPIYTERSLRTLLENAGPSTRVWVWHNGDDAETLSVVRSFEEHPRLHRIHHSEVNLALREPTNWFWARAGGDYLGKVDDDCLVPAGWVERLADAHAAEPRLGAIGCWVFAAEDFDAERAAWKLQDLGGARVMRNCWIQGSGYLMKRRCVEELGPLPEGVSFTIYLKRLASRGWIHGWLTPLLLMDHMDDPRSPNTLMKSGADFERYRPLSAVRFGAMDVDARIEQIRRFARDIHDASIDPRDHVGWRPWLRRARARISATLTRVGRGAG